MQQLNEVRLPDAEHPVVPADEPDEEEQTQDGVAEPGRLGHKQVAITVVSVIHVIKTLVPAIRDSDYN